MNQRLLFVPAIVSTFLILTAASCLAEQVLVEAESFAEHGGWKDAEVRIRRRGETVYCLPEYEG